MDLKEANKMCIATIKAGMWSATHQNIWLIMAICDCILEN